MTDAGTRVRVHALVVCGMEQTAGRLETREGSSAQSLIAVFIGERDVRVVKLLKEKECGSSSFPTHSRILTPP